METQSQARSQSAEPSSQQEISQETSSESTTVSSKGRAGQPKQNGEHVQPSPQAGTSRTSPQPSPGPTKGHDQPTGPGRDDDVIPSERRLQHGEGSHQKRREGRNGEKKIHS